MEPPRFRIVDRAFFLFSALHYEEGMGIQTFLAGMVPETHFRTRLVV